MFHGWKKLCNESLNGLFCSLGPFAVHHRTNADSSISYTLSFLVIGKHLQFPTFYNRRDEPNFTVAHKIH